jgi:TatD DNase family protein
MIYRILLSLYHLFRSAQRIHMFIDTHAHLYLEQFENDFEDVLLRARSCGVGMIVMPAIDILSIEKAIGLCERNEGMYAMAALHPSAVKDASDDDFSRVAELCDSPYVVAIGETGLDYYWDRSFDTKQQDYVRRHIRLAIERDLPIIFHIREATSDLLRIVDEERTTSSQPTRLRGIFHCFTGSAEEAQRMWELGFYLGIGGIVTFKNAGLNDVVRDIPLDRLVLETDAPYLAPAPYRGKRNEPAYVQLVAKTIASTKNVSVDHVADATTNNAKALFHI